jgi:hypothetical protein
VDVRHQQFIISYSPEDEKYAKRLFAVLDKELDSFENFFNIKLEGTFTIEIPASQSEYNTSAGSSIPEWSNALYIPSQRRMIVKKPEWFSSEESFEQVISHELSHLFFHQTYADSAIPLWFNEGLAEYLSGTRIEMPEGVIIANAIFTRKIIPLMHIDSLMLFNSGRARLAYLQSLTAIQFLESIIIKKGLEWNEFLTKVNQDGFEIALKNFSSYDQVDFEIFWYRWLSEKYKWFIILNWENLIWIFITIVLLGALYAVRYRNKKTLENWENDESLQMEPEDQIKIDINIDNSKY